ELPGARQRDVFQIVQAAGIDGIGGGEVRHRAGTLGPQTYTILRGLERRGILETVPGRNPTRWRLAARYQFKAASLGTIPLGRSRVRPELPLISFTRECFGPCGGRVPVCGRLSRYGVSQLSEPDQHAIPSRTIGR